MEIGKKTVLCNIMKIVADFVIVSLLNYFLFCFRYSSSDNAGASIMLYFISLLVELRFFASFYGIFTEWEKKMIRAAIFAGGLLFVSNTLVYIFVAINGPLIIIS